MTSSANSDVPPHDRYGIGVYGVMIHLPEVIANAVRGFHASIGVEDLATRPALLLPDYDAPTRLIWETPAYLPTWCWPIPEQGQASRSWRLRPPQKIACTTVILS